MKATATLLIINSTTAINRDIADIKTRTKFRPQKPTKYKEIDTGNLVFDGFNGDVTPNDDKNKPKPTLEQLFLIIYTDQLTIAIYLNIIIVKKLITMDTFEEDDHIPFESKPFDTLELDVVDKTDEVEKTIDFEADVQNVECDKQTIGFKNRVLSGKDSRKHVDINLSTRISKEDMEKELHELVDLKTRNLK